MDAAEEDFLDEHFNFSGKKDTIIDADNQGKICSLEYHN